MKPNDNAQGGDNAANGQTGTDNQDNKTGQSGQDNAGGDGKNNNQADDGKSGAADGGIDAELERKKKELAGLDSELGARKADIEKVRLEKRTLGGGNGNPQKSQGDQGQSGTGDNQDQGGQNGGNNEPSEETKRLQAELKERREADQREVISNFSKDPKFKLINPGHDVNNANWDEMMGNYVEIDKTGTKEGYLKNLRAAYYATFGERLETNAAEAGRTQGQADAAAADNATGGGGTSDRQDTIVLTAEQRAAAKKLNMSEADYIKGMKLQQDQAARNS